MYIHVYLRAPPWKKVWEALLQKLEVPCICQLGLHLSTCNSIASEHKKVMKVERHRKRFVYEHNEV